MQARGEDGRKAMRCGKGGEGDDESGEGGEKGKGRVKGEEGGAVRSEKEG